MTVQEAAGISIEALAALGRGVADAARRTTLAHALQDLAAGARVATGADAVIVRVADGDELEAVAVAGPAALAAELEGDRVPRGEPTESRVLERIDASSVLRVPAGSASLELYHSSPFTASEELAADLAAGLVAIVLRAFAIDASTPAEHALDLAGEALAAAWHETAPAAEVVRLAAGVVGARVGLLWQRDEGDTLKLVGSHGLEPEADTAAAAQAVATALAGGGAVRTIAADGLPRGCAVSATLALGEPPVGFLQLLFSRGAEPGAAELGRLTTFGVRAAHVLRSGARARAVELELERARALLAVVGQATAELSLAHTLETAVHRIAELLDVERVAVYLRSGERLTHAAGPGLTGPHARVAERLLELAIGPARRRPLVEIVDTATDQRLGDARDAAREAGIEAVLAIALVVRDDVIGLLAAYPDRGRQATESEATLLGALASQLAVAVQNAQLHERTAELSAQRETALASEREAARRLGALYEISRSFAQSLSLDATLEAVVGTVVDVVDVDAALIRMPDARREMLEPRALHVKDAVLADAVRAVLWRPQPFGATAVQRVFRERAPVRLRRRNASELLDPFLEKGWTGAMVPVATPAEVIASLGVFSFRPGSPITAATVEAVLAIAGQAALAIDNARLYQVQKEFADTMQRSLLPRTRPALPGLEVGEVYRSSARVDVGGDIYDFVTLDDGRLAVVLGDVTGHGVDATADMAMAKFVFRSLAREHPEPSAFLAAANDVIVDEIATGKFITMTYLAIDGSRGEVACASAGHPPPRLLLPDGTVRALQSSGLALGIESGQRYDELRTDVPAGATIVVYTDGVVEARRNRELYGIERLDAFLRSHRELRPPVLAEAIADDARAFAGGELADDVAVVVIRRR